MRVVGPIGVDLEPVISVLCQELLTVGYSHNPIQLSRQIERFFDSDHSDETEDKRIANLMDEGTRLRSESGCGDAVAWLGIVEIAEEMVERDEEEESTSLGQDVRDAFPLADLFVDSRNKPALAQQVRRFFELLFGNVFHTPSRDDRAI